MLNLLVNRVKLMQSAYEMQGVKYLNQIDQCANFQAALTLLKNLKTEDFDFHQDLMSYFSTKRTKYLNVLNEGTLGIGVFLFHKGAITGIHDHPKTLVLTKVLEGKLKIQPYDIIDKSIQNKIHMDYLSETSKSNEKFYVKSAKSNCLYLNKGDINYLTPSKENAHNVSALEACPMLDIFIPNENYRIFYKEEKDQILINLAKGSTFEVEKIYFQDVSSLKI